MKIIAALMMLFLLYCIMERYVNIREYRKLAYQDVLTELGNRAAFMKEQNGLSAGSSVGYVVMDINDLKRTNDRFGHQEGDELIRCAAECISRAFQCRGKAFRIGGDEFVVIVENATEECLLQLLEKLEREQEKKRQALEKPWKLQIAYGYAVHSGEGGYEELFRLADERMYECKRRMKEA